MKNPSTIINTTFFVLQSRLKGCIKLCYNKQISTTGNESREASNKHNVDHFFFFSLYMKRRCSRKCSMKGIRAYIVREYFNHVREYFNHVREYFSHVREYFSHVREYFNHVREYFSHGSLNRLRVMGLSFYHPMPSNCLGQTLTTRVLSQHFVSSSKTIKSGISWGARCVRHCEMTWSAVCSVAPHSQFENGARPHLYLDEQKSRWRLSLTQDALDKRILISLVQTLGMEA